MASFEKLEGKFRSAPLQSAGVTLVAAWLLSRLPIFGILGFAMRIALGLVKPALLILGGAKAWGLIQARHEEASQAAPENHF